ncbi:MAG TPA: amino acid adenylation domain-containing protein, partial [Ktedonobacteraceae bacterium]|nr:amino acid adenylation domain-containing protein [Ktedonobacteraceae bacterium]
ALLKQAFQKLVERHDILRTSFRTLAGMTYPLQIVNEENNLFWQQISLTRFASDEQEKRLAKAVNGELMLQLDLEHDALMRCILFQRTEEYATLLVTIPRMLVDGQSLIILMQEMSELYISRLQVSPDADEERIQYAQFATWQNEELEDRVLTEESYRFWQEQQGDLSSHLHPSWPEEDQETLASIFWSASFSPAFLEEIAAIYSATIEDVLLTAWQVLLWRLHRDQEQLLGYQVSGRDFEELLTVPGSFARSVPLRVAIKEQVTFAELLERVRDNHQKAQDWQIDYEQKHRVYFDAGFAFTRIYQPVLNDDITFSVHTVQTSDEPFPLHLACASKPDVLLATLRCDTGTMQIEQLERLGLYLQAILKAVRSTPHIYCSSIELVTDQERQRQLTIFNPEEYQLSKSPLVFARFAQQAALTPGHVAVRFEETSLTYEELNARANQLAHYLGRLGAGPDVPVGVYMEHSLEMIVALLGILKAGSAYLPLDPRYPQERLSFMLTDIQAPVVLTQQALLTSSLDYTGRLIALDSGWEVISHESTDEPHSALTPDHLAYIIYTSGSTGQPKGVMIPHRGLTNYLDWCMQAYTSGGGNGSLVHSSLSFDLTVTSVFAPLMCGQKITLVSRSHGIDSLTRALNDESEDYAFLKLTPAHVRLLGRFLANKQVAARINSLIIGGEALSADDITTWQEEIPDIRIYNEYGPTETVVGCSVYDVPDDNSYQDAVPIGTPIDNTQIYLLDAQMRLVPLGVPGEIYIGGAGLARGYAGRPDLTAERFVPHPFSVVPGDRLYRSGDLARYREDGTIEYAGRIDHQVKIRGFRVEPGEIETVLGRHPALQDVAVIVREDTPGNRRLVAYVVARSITQGYSVNDLRAFAGRHLPDYMVPSAFVFMDALPLTTNGKLDLRALPVPEVGRPALEHEYVEPSTREEQILAATWSQVLSIDHVGIYDNYFALGGDSIRSIQVVALTQERGLQLTVDQIFEYPTIYDLARVLVGSSEETEESSPFAPYRLISPQDRALLPEDVEDAYPLTRLQAGMIFHKELMPRSSIYHDITSFHIKAPLSLEHLQQAISLLVQRHPTLRTSYELSSYSEPLQLVHRQGTITLQVVDLQDRTFHEQRSYLEQWIEEEKSIGFDTASWPMMRLTVHLRSAETYQFTVSFHHAILDGWSEATMLTELFHSYLALMQGKHPDVPVPTATFQDFVALEREALADQEQQNFWTRKLQDHTFLSLPRWKAPPTDKSQLREIIVLDVPLSDQTSEGLKQLALKAAVPIKDVLLAAHIRVLSLLSNVSDVLTCLVSSGRPEYRDGDRAMGLFINSLPLRLQLSEGTWLDLAKATFDAECESLPYRRYPMAEVKSLQGGQALSETLFYFTHYHVYQSLQEIADLDILDHYLYEETSFVLAANFRVDPFTSHVHVNLKCDGSQLTREQVYLMGTYYAQTLQAMAAHPTQRYDLATLIGAEEQHRLLQVWNHTSLEGIPPASTLCLHEQFAARARQFPEATAITFGETRISYAELETRSNQLAHYLRAQGVGPETLVGLCFERSPELLVSMLGILKAGGAYVPLDPTTPTDRLAFIIEDARLTWLLTHQDCLDRLPESADTQLIDLGGISSQLVDFPVLPPQSGVAPDNLAYVIYTSGSTGRPKGTFISHANVSRLLTSTQPWFTFAETDVWTLFHSYAFDFSVWEIWGALAHGGRLVIVPYWIARDADTFYKMVVEEQVTVLNQTPSAFKLFCEQDEQNQQKLALRLVIFGGEALDPGLPRSWFALHSDQQPRLVNMYGI